MIIRFDDISANTDHKELLKLIKVIKDRFPDSELWFAVNLFAKSSESERGSVYPDIPFKDRDNSYFYDIDLFKIPFMGCSGKIISHGLIHADHSRLDYGAQEMSIVTSAKYLGTDTFIPPFNRFNSDTETICNKYDIKLIKLSDGWKSMEHNSFDDSHAQWYLHPWKWDEKSLENYLAIGDDYSCTVPVEPIKVIE